MTLSEKSITAFEAPAKGRRLIFDDHRDAPRGFGIRLNADGTKVFILRYKVAGKDRLMKIGQHGPNEWSLAAARKRAGDLRQDIDRGVDILEQRREQAAELTVRDVMDRYCKARVDHTASGKSTRRTLERHLLPALGRKRITAVRRAQVIELVESLAAKHPREAGKLLSSIKLMFAYAEDREIIEGNPVATLKAAKIGKGLTSRKCQRVLDDDEVKAFWNNVEGSGMRKLTALALKFILVTGARPGEVAGMHHDEVEGNVWTVPAERRLKTETSYTVPLTGIALAILEAAKAEVARLSERRRGRSGGYVFEVRPGKPTTGTSLPQAVSRFADALENKDDKAEGHWTPHDLRRTCRTGLAAAGVNETVAELAIGHTRKGIAGVYDLHRYDHEKRAALEAWERRLLRIVSGDPADDNVIRIQRSAV